MRCLGLRPCEADFLQATRSACSDRSGAYALLSCGRTGQRLRCPWGHLGIAWGLAEVRGLVQRECRGGTPRFFPRCDWVMCQVPGARRPGLPLVPALSPATEQP